jgi:hypothetical protein
MNIYAKKWLKLSWETILLHTTNLIYGAIECLCKKKVGAFVGNYPVTYNQPDKLSLDREAREVEMKIVYKQKLHGKFGAHIHPTETPNQTLALHNQ